MKIKYALSCPVFSAVLITANATAQLSFVSSNNFISQIRTKVLTTNILTPQERQELQTLRQQKEISDRVQTEVDRAFNRQSNFILLWLIGLTLLPMATAISIWFLRRSLITEIVSNLPSELKQEIFPKLEVNPTDEVNQQINNFHQEIADRLQQLETFCLEIRQERDKYFQEISAVNYSYSAEPVGAENQMTIEQKSENTLQLFTVVEPNQEAIEPVNQTSEYVIESEESRLDSNSPVFTAIDYFNQGNQHLNEGRYTEANISFNQAVQLDRDFSEARYQNAKAYAMRRNVNPAIGNLQWAIDIDPSYKEKANNDSAFDIFREDENFKKIIEE